ncbi:colanic acid biosynthesis glycosyltransferase WcaL [Vibrio aquaticus]|uniref:Colanic acid biosynthesis glycosyltransferase WcaL n=2 Tax=Vibrio aquaticus TaxID=2496559 RepID=A0A432D317_9VIBR|nr:colanic acid biosynthesis glycosyltransferase WcaL [Vibrio aquaticus]
MKITYFINQYPHVSHTFIRREILELEDQGFDIQRVALRGWDSNVVDETDKSERAKTLYVLQSGLKALLPVFFRQLIKQPGRVFLAIKLAAQMTYMSERNFAYHLIYLFEACQLAEFCAQHESEHVHAHFGTNSTEVVMLAKLLSGIEYSFTVHGPEEFDKPLSLHLREKVNLSKFVAAISSFGRSQLYRWTDLEDWNKVKIVHCGLDDSFLQGQPEPKLNSETKQLLCIGRLCEQKGQLLLLRSVKAALDEGANVKLVLAGDGDMRPDVETYIRQHHLEDRVTITGWISSDKVKQLLLDSDAMILPSFAEGLPVAIMEAMAIGRPVITTYIAGIPELLSNRENALLFPAGDINATKNAIVDFTQLTDNELNQMVRKAYDAVEAKHNIKTEASKLASFIRGEI